MTKTPQLSRTVRLWFVPHSGLLVWKECLVWGELPPGRCHLWVGCLGFQSCCVYSYTGYLWLQKRERNLGACCNLVDLEIWSFIKEQKSYVHCGNSLKESSERQNPAQNERLENWNAINLCCPMKVPMVLMVVHFSKVMVPQVIPIPCIFILFRRSKTFET